MGLRNFSRSAASGQFTTKDEAIADPGGTTRETYGDANRRVEIKAAAEAVILGEGYAQAEGRTEVNQADLDRLKAALGFEPGQP